METDTSDGRGRSRIGGAVLLAVGLAFAWQALDYPLGTLHRTGPGFFPLSLALVVAGLGLALIVTAPPMPDGVLPIAGRPLACISLACVVFIVLIERAGLIPAAFVCVLVASLSEPHPRPVPSATLAVIVSLGVWAVFVLGLGLQLPAFGGK